MNSIRLNLVFFSFSLFYCALVINLFIIQIMQSSFFKSRAQHQYTTLITALLPRAEILDRNGKPLAINISRLSAFMIPAKMSQPKKLKKFLAEFFPRAYERLHKNQKSSQPAFFYIKRYLTDQEVQIIKESGLRDIHFLKEPNRFYPVSAAGQVIGMTDIDNKGLFGLEKAYDSILAGNPAIYSLEQEGRSGHYHFNKTAQAEGNQGTPITLTIDSTLQFLAYEEAKEAVNSLHAAEGAVLILDPAQGDILAMAHYPGFDPNIRETKPDLEKTKNKIVTDTYELGSVIKVFLALAALEEKVVTPDEIIDCHNTKTALIDGFKVNTLKAHGLLTFSQVIELSNNIGTSKIAQRLGPLLYSHYRRCGFGQKTGLHFPGEQKGFVNPPNKWSKLSIFSLSFGYEIRATLLQLARAFSLIANNGFLVTPRLLFLSSHAPAFDKTQTSLYKPETVAQMREILKKTITRGTARRGHINGYEIFGKTGSANLISDGIYDPNRNIFTFVGLIEKESYKRIIVTFIKETTKPHATASSTAVPFFEKIAHKMLIHDKII